MSTEGPQTCCKHWNLARAVNLALATVDSVEPKELSKTEIHLLIRGSRMDEREVCDVIQAWRKQEAWTGKVKAALWDKHDGLTYVVVTSSKEKGNV